MSFSFSNFKVTRSLYYNYKTLIKKMLRHFRKCINSFNTSILLKNNNNQSIARYGQQSYGRYTELIEGDGVRQICLSDPRTHNALSMGMLEEIEQCICSNWHDKNLRCIVIASNGSVWSSGHDLNELLPDKSLEQKKKIFEMLYELTKRIQEAPVPVIAKVNGLVAAGGVQLVASCDMTVCSNTSKFVMPSANFGIFAATPVVPMSRLMPPNKCLDMLFTGQPILAEDAIKYGLVSRVVPNNDLDEEMDKIISSIKSKSRSVLALGKKFFYKQLELPLNKAYDEAITQMLANLEMDDSKEGIKSFIEKRKPVWSNL